jgi:hypothetical protein
MVVVIMKRFLRLRFVTMKQAYLPVCHFDLCKSGGTELFIYSLIVIIGLENLFHQLKFRKNAYFAIVIKHYRVSSTVMSMCPFEEEFDVEMAVLLFISHHHHLLALTHQSGQHASAVS